MKSKAAKIREILEITEGTVGKKKQKQRLPALHVIRESEPLPETYIEGDIVVFAPSEN